MAVENVITIKKNIVEWQLKDGTGVVAATGNIYWDTSVGATTPSTLYSWLVESIEFCPATGQATGGFCRLFDGGETTAYAELVRFNFQTVLQGPIIARFGDKPKRCQPVYPSTLQNGLTTGAKIIFHLA